MEYLILDTNILLLDANNLLTLGKDYIIVLPETVIDELDVKKTDDKPDLRFQARQFGRILTNTTIVDILVTDTHAIVTRQYEDVIIKTISLTKYDVFDDSEVNIRNDRKILQATKFFADLGHKVTFMSNDVMCRERALVYGINSIDLKLVEISEDKFTKQLTIPSSVFVKLHNMLILDVDPEYVPANYNYIFADETTGQTKLANLRNGMVDVLGKDTETELRRQDVAPANSGQLFLARAIQNPNIDIVVCEASAGTGKTLTAFSNALQLVKKKDYNQIIYIRNSVDDVEKAEEMGFRSGNDEKVAPYFGPVDDTLDFIVRNRYKSSKLKGKAFEDFVDEQVEEMKLRYCITTITTLGLRGRTFKKGTVIIMDESQNQTASSFQKVLTRVGEQCKLIIMGSNKQIDHPYITKHTNGLSVLLDACTKEQTNVKLYAVPLTKILRSNIAEFAETTFSKVKR